MYFFKFNCKKKGHIGAIINKIYKKFQKVSFEKISLQKQVFWEKKSPKG